MSGQPGRRLPSTFTPLTYGVVTLRAFRDTDTSALIACLQDPQIPRWTRIPSPYGEREARQSLARRALAWRRDERASLAVVDPRGGERLGAVGLAYVEWEDEKAEIGYWVAAPAHGRGVALRAVRLLARWAFADLGLFRLEILAEVENPASIAVARACGFSEEGVLRGNTLIRGRRGDSLIFSLLRTDPASAELSTAARR
jgi:RimJ/RimL family protein N-acetyltransferase